MPEYISYFFSREQERKCGTAGFLDSKKFTHTYEVAEKQQQQQQPTKRAGTPRPGEKSEFTKPLDAVSIVLKSDQDKKEYDKRIKVIEVCRISVTSKSGQSD
mgnify:CR=1 FL=1